MFTCYNSSCRPVGLCKGRLEPKTDHLSNISSHYLLLPNPGKFSFHALGLFCISPLWHCSLKFNTRCTGYPCPKLIGKGWTLKKKVKKQVYSKGALMTSQIWFFEPGQLSSPVCGPQVATLIYCKRLKCPTFFNKLAHASSQASGTWAWIWYSNLFFQLISCSGTTRSSSWPALGPSSGSCPTERRSE